MEQNKDKRIKKLISSFKCGDSAAFEELMSFTYKDLFLLSYSYLKDKMLAEDAVSEAFMKLFEKASSIKSEQNLTGYLRTIVINKSLDIIRKRRNEVCPGDDVLNLKAYEPEDAQTHVRSILFMLDDSEREVLLLWQYDYTLSEISLKTGITVNQVRLRLDKAKNKFISEYNKN